MSSETIIQIIKRNHVINNREWLQFVKDTEPIIRDLSKYKERCIELLREILDSTSLHVKVLHDIIEDYTRKQ